jgi:type II secretory pathway component PulC
MTKTENLIESQKSPEEQIPLKSFYGLQYSLYSLNLVLFCMVILLSIVSFGLYTFSSNKKIPVSPSNSTIQETVRGLGNSILGGMISNPDKKSNQDFDIVSSKNIFSAGRKEWIPKPKVRSNGGPHLPPPSPPPPPPPPPRKIILYGIIMADKVKKAMINNPKVGVRDKKTLYIEEGEDVEGYKVKRIEKDKVILDWQGSEIVLKLYTGSDDKKN